MGHLQGNTSSETAGVHVPLGLTIVLDRVMDRHHGMELE